MPVPHQPPSHLPLASSLPKVSFRQVPEPEARALSVPSGVQDQQLINFGFNDGTDFEKPEHYLRHVEPIESELNKQVEYDMDEQDQEWLDAVNADRRREQLDSVTYEAFEVIIDRLEKEWFDLMKRVPQKSLPNQAGSNGEANGDGNEDMPCAICDDGECENSNAIVFCDGCNLAVHQDCYGIPYIPEGQWLCRKCTVSPDRAVSCVLCPHEGGAFKQTTQGKWAHLLCAMWIPETGVSNPVYMEPIDSVERIPKARWKLQCYICRRRVGACIQCDSKHCVTAFHVTCARRAGLLLKSQRQRIGHSPDADENEESGEQLRAWCHKHLPKSIRAQRARDEEFQDAHSQPPSPVLGSPSKARGGQSLPATPARKKSARAYKRSYRPGLSLVPAYVVDRVLEYVARLPLRKKQHFVVQVARFWSLKREARRGAPLLKRLHLEPWTASAASKEQTEVDRLKTLRFLLHLREDLEKVRMLAELVRKREKEKQRQAAVIRSALVENVLFPYTSVMRTALERIAALDRSSLFLNPVSAQSVPDYYEIVKKPMDWSTISAKLDDLRYTSLHEFKNDIFLVLNNAMLYNKVDTPYHRTAARILHVAGPIFVELDQLTAVHGDESYLELEPEQTVVDLLDDQMSETNEADVSSDVANVIEDYTRQSYQFEPDLRKLGRGPPSDSKHHTSLKSTGRKANRVERGREAAQKRQEARSRQRLGGAAEEAKETADEEDVADAQMKPRLRRTLRNHRTGSDSLYDDGRDDTQQERHERESDEPEPTELEVKQVDSWDSFKRFNVGWVLPQGAKRSRSKPHPDSIGQSQSLSALSPGQEDALDVRSGGRKRSLTGTSDQTRLKRSRSASNTQQATASDEDAVMEVPVKRALRGRTDPTNTQMSNGVNGQRKTKRAETSSTSTMYEPSTLCWAKLEGHPFFPAEVYAEGDEEVPSNVLNSKPEMYNERDDPTYLIRFFDNTRTFGWVTQSKLRLLYEDEELDARMIRSAKSSRHRKVVQTAYDRAKAQAE